MLREMIKPGSVVKLLAGLSHMFFERIQGNGNGHMNGQESAVVVATAVSPDDLTLITGIGPTIAKRLQDAGIRTFADLAGSTPEGIREAAQVANWQGDPADWIMQAQAKL